jgi:hypothetical protein
MSFDFQPTLKGELLELRPLRAEDFDDLYAVASDPLIWEQHPIRDRYKEEIFKGFFREALESGGALIVIDSRNDRVIGSSRFHGYSAFHIQAKLKTCVIAEQTDLRASIRFGRGAIRSVRRDERYRDGDPLCVFGVTVDDVESQCARHMS